jgi:FKBP-type peptidyl-prolyl cis-trans isomerase FkpA
VGATTAPSAVASGSKTAAAPSAPPFLKPVSLRQLLGEAEEETGLKFQDLVTGIGPSIKMGDEARVHYTGRFVDGKEFDSSRNRGKPLEFTMGKGMVVPGFERGIVGMRTGGVRRITVPPHLGYGERGSPPAIPPNATLVFEVELVEIPIPAEKEAPKDTRPSGPQIGGQ